MVTLKRTLQQSLVWIKTNLRTFKTKFICRVSIVLYFSSIFLFQFYRLFKATTDAPEIPGISCFLFILFSDVTFL